MSEVTKTGAARGDTRTKPSGMNAEIKALSARDNWTNWYYIGRIWLIIGLTITACVWAHNEIIAQGLHWAWHIPVLVAGLVLIGASQHEFGGVLHEATHFMLFKNRYLNDIAADWLAGFPMYTSIHHYRLYHLAHHQFVNDPVRDPDTAQMRMSGHWMDFPVTHIEILWKLAKQLWLPNLFRYSLGRMKSHAFDADHNPYFDPARKGSKGPLIVTLLTWFAAPIIAPRFFYAGHPEWALVFIGAVWALAMIYYAAIPASSFGGSRLEPVISHRATAMSRVTFVSLVYAAITAVDIHIGAVRAMRVFEVYWIGALFTTFPLFMVMRHWVHHGNADRGRYTNTRVYLVNPLVRYALFPFGFEYHLPHHMYASVPHFRLKRLHDVLQQDPEYLEKAMVVEGYFGHGNPELGRPSAIGALGPDYAPKGTERAFLDGSVLEPVVVADQVGIERAVRESAHEDSLTAPKSEPDEPPQRASA